MNTPKYEYIREQILDDSDLIAKLNKFGMEGWEVCLIKEMYISEEDYFEVYMKRLLPELEEKRTIFGSEIILMPKNNTKLLDDILRYSGHFQ